MGMGTKSEFRLGARAWALERCSHTSVLGTKNIHKQLGKGNKYREIRGKFGVVTRKKLMRKQIQRGWTKTCSD